MEDGYYSGIDISKNKLNKHTTTCYNKVKTL